MTEPADSAGRVEIMQRAIRRMMLGGNHLATYIDPDGPTWREEVDAGLRHYGAGLAYDCWCCWRAIMQAREMLDTNEGRTVLQDAAPDKPPRDHWARKVLP